MPLIGRPPIGHREGVARMMEQRRHDVDLHGGTARTAPRPLQGLGAFVVETAWRAIFQADPPKGRQQGRGTLRLQGDKVLAQCQLPPLLHRRHGLRGIEALLEGLGRHDGLRMARLKKRAHPAQRHGRIVQPVGRHQGKKIGPGQPAVGPLDTVGLPRKASNGSGANRAVSFSLTFPATG